MRLDLNLEQEEFCFLDAAGRRQFAVYHVPALAERTRAIGALLCQPVGEESIRAHRAVRRLGQLVAARGIPTLRFDYSGCGDSEGEFEAFGLSAWCEETHELTSVFRDTLGLDGVVLVGLRLGASIALEVACAREDVPGVALWSPVVSGRAHLEELIATESEWRTHAFTGEGEAPASESEVLGFPLSSRLRRELISLDLTATLARTQRASLAALVLDEPGVSLDALSAALAALGRAPQCTEAAGASVWTKDATGDDQPVVPADALGCIAEWVAACAV